MQTIEKLVDTLCVASRRRLCNVYDAFAWPATIDPSTDMVWSPELCSLHGTEVWDRLDERARCRLGFFEAVNFFSLNIRGEVSLMRGLAERLYAPRLGPVSPYLHHFLDEENKHSVLFGEFCQRYAGKVYPDRKVVATSTPDGVEADFVFFAKVMVFEEVVDHYNLRMGDDDRLHPIAVAINRNHHLEESRHLAFGRRMFTDLWQELSTSAPPETVQNVRAHIEQFLHVSFREYYNPLMYGDAGLPELLSTGAASMDPWSLQRLAWQHPESRARRARAAEKCLEFLRRTGFLPEIELT
jgi:hypothetical protein